MIISVYGTRNDAEYVEALLAGLVARGIEIRDRRDGGWLKQTMAFQRDVEQPDVLIVVSDFSAWIAVVLRVIGDIPIVWVPVREHGETQSPGHKGISKISGWLGSWAADLILLDVRAAAVRFVRKYSAKQSELLWLDGSNSETPIDQFLAAITRMGD